MRDMIYDGASAVNNRTKNNINKIRNLVRKRPGRLRRRRDQSACTQNLHPYIYSRYRLLPLSLAHTHPGHHLRHHLRTHTEVGQGNSGDRDLCCDNLAPSAITTTAHPDYARCPAACHLPSLAASPVFPRAQSGAVAIHSSTSARMLSVATTCTQ